MARAATTLHGINKAGASSDTFVFTDDYTNLIARLEEAIRGLAAYAAGSNYVNTNALNAGKILSAIGDSYRGRVIGVAAAADAQLTFQDNAGGTGADKFSAGYDDSADALVISAGATLGNGLKMDTSGHLTTLTTDMGVRGGVLQGFVLRVKNDAGTLKHAVFGLDYNNPALVASRITGFSNTLTATNLDWTAWTTGVSIGSGGNGNHLVFNTAVQVGGNVFGVASIGYGTNATPRTVLVNVKSITVAGVAALRPTLQLFAEGGASYNWSSLGSGELLDINVILNIA